MVGFLTARQAAPQPGDTDVSLVESFERVAAAYRSRTALISDLWRPTYEELNFSANRLAHALLARKSAAEGRIAILMEHDAPLIAAILAAAMSNLSAALNSLSSTSMVDFYLRRRPEIDDKARLRLSRLSTVIWALVLFALAVLSLHKVGRVVEVGLQIASVAYGAMLGVFLLGVLTSRANQAGAIVGMICGLAVELWIWSSTAVPWTWYVAIGTVVTFGVGYAASLVLKAEPGATSRQSL